MSDINDDLANEWLKDKLINPITKRKIKFNGTVFKMFMKYVEERELGQLFDNFHI